MGNRQHLVFHKSNFVLRIVLHYNFLVAWSNFWKVLPVDCDVYKWFSLLTSLYCDIFLCIFLYNIWQIETKLWYLDFPGFFVGISLDVIVWFLDNGYEVWYWFVSWEWKRTSQAVIFSWCCLFCSSCWISVMLWIIDRNKRKSLKPQKHHW